MQPDGQALFAFVRFWSRRWTGGGLGVDAERGRDVMVLEAIHALSAANKPTSVNDVARELGVDQSGASRMIARAQRQGLVTRRAPVKVGGAAAIASTGAGDELLRQARAWQNEVVRRLTAGWADDEVRTLMTLMDRLVHAQNAIDAADQAP
ncbi:MarR family winged helix-turn-helix transcriptional regulator [Dactylosporangium darangshiense]|uniref:HTH marR-type domain-containing protein n=1 Tax=Dactylosporangium darangshiense TaxID=579108 RepID=A0ABP8DKX3_9ACTN